MAGRTRPQVKSKLFASSNAAKGVTGRTGFHGGPPAGGHFPHGWRQSFRNLSPAVSTYNGMDVSDRSGLWLCPGPRGGALLYTRPRVQGETPAPPVFGKETTPFGIGYFG